MDLVELNVGGLGVLDDELLQCLEARTLDEVDDALGGLATYAIIGYGQRFEAFCVREGLEELQMRLIHKSVIDHIQLGDILWYELTKAGSHRYE